jgi:cellulose synthase/poly-beta-1,6-N-acetylglucosamine synthase-like glycosyltransferase
MTILQLLVTAGWILSVLYAGLMIFYIRGWLKLRRFRFDPAKAGTTAITVIIPVRNEEEIITECLESLRAQEYAPELMQVIIIDDFSVDRTYAKAGEYIREKDLKNFLLLRNTGNLKKEAIAEAIGFSTGELIITTDADCRAGKHWLASMVQYYEVYKPKMLAGPVSYYGERNLFEKMQTLEFIGLVSIGAAGIANNSPLMCNGANLLYEKEAFYKAGGFGEASGIASGDDTFLLFEISKLFSGQVHFIKSPEACIYTKPKSSVPDFFNQRKRWSSKTRFYRNLPVKLIALLVYLVNSILLILLLAMLFTAKISEDVLPMLGLKALMDFLFLYISSAFFRRRRLLYLFLPEQLLYLLYIFVIGTLAPFGSFEWKGRKLKR